MDLRDRKQMVLCSLLPESIIKEIICFVLYDHHPMDQRHLDITICTKYELQEYYQRELRSSMQINNGSKITILRNFKCELHYLVHSDNDIIILSSKKEQISIIRTVHSVINVTIEDPACTGQPILKIMQEDDGLPLVFNDNFEIVNARLTYTQPEPQSECSESQSIINKLRNKLTEARYTTKCNENTLKEYVKIRQLAAFSIYQKTCANSDVSLNLKEISRVLKVDTQEPKVKLCNKKIVVILRITNKNSKQMENVHILLHGSSLPSISYITRLFKETPSSPNFEEIDTNIESKTKSIVVAIIDLTELKYNVTSRIDFDVVVSYKINDKFFLLPFKSVSISALDTMGMDFDILATGKDFSKTVLAILATSHNFDLQLRSFKESDAIKVDFSKVFHENLNMTCHINFEDVALHNESPYHVLHGVMVIFNGYQNNVLNVKVYTRHPSQALALIHYIYEKVPYNIIVTTPEIKIRPINNLMFNYNEDLNMTNVYYINSIYPIISQIKLYLIDCMKNMNKGSITHNRINYMALGTSKYLEFRKQILRGLEIP